MIQSLYEILKLDLIPQQGYLRKMTVSRDLRLNCIFPKRKQAKFPEKQKYKITSTTRTQFVECRFCKFCKDILLVSILLSHF